mmetsp:Transcript_16522/g.39299  ORF Transcript_16522/g.39299 Transcript_16522/m.39299 type:complete len:237 (-) Transcript_16522:1842-2552(-)
MRSLSNDHGLLLEDGHVRKYGMNLQSLLVLDILFPLELGLLRLLDDLGLVLFALGLDLLLVPRLDERKLFDPRRTDDVVELFGCLADLALGLVLLLVGLLGVLLGEGGGIYGGELVLRHGLGILAHGLEVTLLFHGLHFALNLHHLLPLAELLLSLQAAGLLRLGGGLALGLDAFLLLELLLGETLGFLLPLLDELLPGQHGLVLGVKIGPNVGEDGLADGGGMDLVGGADDGADG